MEHRHLWKARPSRGRANAMTTPRRGTGGIWTVVALAIAVLLAALGSAADEGSPRAGADETIWKTIFRGSTEVNVVNVDVVVTDRDGRPVTDLTKADFDLYDGKKRVEISNFFAVANGETVPLISLEEIGRAHV